MHDVTLVFLAHTFSCLQRVPLLLLLMRVPSNTIGLQSESEQRKPSGVHVKGHKVM